MAPDSGDSRITLITMSNSGGTGDSEQYQTEDGRTWRRLSPFAGPPTTGETRGYIDGDYIRERT